MKSDLVAIAALSAGDRDAMYTLLNTHFSGVNRSVFEADLDAKNWVILLRDDHSKTLKGFSTLLMYDTEFAGERLSVVYSGDTIMDPSAWSSSALSRSWITAVNQLRRQYARGRLYWLLISSGYRTYRFLPTFWQEFYPHYALPTPPHMQALMAFLAGQQFGTLYDPQAGIVRFPQPQSLREHLQGIPSDRLKDPHINFFAAQNPGYIEGDNLVCLTELVETNITPAGQRIWSATLAASAPTALV